MVSAAPTPELALVVLDTTTVAIAAMLAMLGGIVIIAGWFGLGPTGGIRQVAQSAMAVLATRTGLAISGAIAVFTITGWPVPTLFAAAGGWFLPTLHSAKRERKKSIERVEAIAGWLENVRDNLSGSAGLMQALTMSAEQAPAAIRPEVRNLALRLHHESIEVALRHFAAEAAHPTADLAVGSLLLASKGSAGNLSTVLAHTAQAARDSAAMRRQVEAGRASTHAQARLVGRLSLGSALAITATQESLVGVYSSLTGQIALAVFCSMATASVYLVYRNSKPVEAPRVFAGVESGPDPEPLALDNLGPEGAEPAAAGQPTGSGVR